MKQTRNLLVVVGAIALVAVVLAACGGGSGSGNSEAEAAAASIPTDGILGELPKVVDEYEAAEAAASAKYDELKQSDPQKAREFWSDYINQGNTTKYKKETLPAVKKTLEGKEIPTELAGDLPLKLDKNLTLDDKGHAATTGTFTIGADNKTPLATYGSVAYDSDGQAIETGRGISFHNYPIAEGKQFDFSWAISVKGSNAAQWAKLAKIVIMDKESEAYKQAEEQIKAAKEAAKN